jgi:eukaryotic-like serine/threonine-protein kinase
VTPPSDRLAAALADRYRLERELGQGGMATVHLAEDLKHHRKVALKVLKPELAATMGADRFDREIEVAARLVHPHILGLIDSGDLDGFFYYVMPYVEGETLRERLARSGEMPVHEAVRLLGEIADALAVAHKAGVVHRDIKPENILLSGRHAMVMDFGVAKAVTEASGRQQLTTAGVALGTPAYMAPEQATADPHLDGRVDIYALGILAYEMLTGYPPFHGLNPQQTLAAHVTQAPVVVGQRRPGLSPALESVVMRCLAKRPADRFQSADELVAVLEPLATPSGGMTPAHTMPVPATATATAARSSRRHAAVCRGAEALAGPLGGAPGGRRSRACWGWIESRLPSDPADPLRRRKAHQTFTRSSGARYNPCPCSTAKARYQASMFRTVSPR